MNFEKTAKSFNMHFGKDCEKICFSGMSIPFLSGADTSLCGAVSIGGCLALSKRCDGRFTAEFDDNQKYISTNISEFKHHMEEPMLEFMESIKKSGVTLCGADVLFEYNTGIYNEYEPLLLSSLYLFCTKMPQPIKLKSCLTNPLREFASVVGRRETLLFSEGEKHTHIKFSDSIVKIVLCCLEEENKMEETDGINIENAASGLAAGDYIRFGKIITAEHSRLVEKGGIGSRTKNLFGLAVNLKDALGVGILQSGGIFAIVENKKVNAFIQNLKKEYENYYGASPDFYVTRTENSGINGIVKKADL